MLLLCGVSLLCRHGCLIRPRTIRPPRPALPGNLVLPRKPTSRLLTNGSVSLLSSRTSVKGK